MGLGQQPARASRTAASGPGTHGQSRRPQWPPGSRRMPLQPRPARAPDVHRVEIPDVNGFGRLDAGPREGQGEDARVGLLHADLERVDDEVEMPGQPQRAEERAHGAVRIGDDAHAQPGGPGEGEGRVALGIDDVEDAHGRVVGLAPRRHRPRRRGSPMPSSSRIS